MVKKIKEIKVTFQFKKDLSIDFKLDKKKFEDFKKSIEANKFIHINDEVSINIDNVLYIRYE